MEIFNVIKARVVANVDKALDPRRKYEGKSPEEIKAELLKTAQTGAALNNLLSDVSEQHPKTSGIVLIVRGALRRVIFQDVAAAARAISDTPNQGEQKGGTSG